MVSFNVFVTMGGIVELEEDEDPDPDPDPDPGEELPDWSFPEGSLELSLGIFFVYIKHSTQDFLPTF